MSMADAEVETERQLPPAEEEEDFGGPIKSFLEHLEDLRWVIIKSVAALAIGMLACMFGGKYLIAALKTPLIQAGIQDDVRIEVFGPIAGFMIVLRLAFWGGLVIALPFILYFIGDFVIPALRPVEKKYLYSAFGIGTGLFVLGGCLGFFWILPVSLKAFIIFNDWAGLPSQIWRGEDYFPFISKLVLGVGISFELPVLVLTLVKLGLLSHESLVKGRKYMVVGNLVIAAFITPQDLISTVMMAAPLQILYETCIWISAYWLRQERKRERQASQALSPPPPPPET